MSTKELLYIEDVLDHEKASMTRCQELSGQLVDADLKAFVSNLANRHSSSFSEFFSLLNK